MIRPLDGHFAQLPLLVAAMRAHAPGGLKRTHRGKLAEYDFAGWRKDRAGMFSRAFELAVEDPKIETWLDPGPR